VVTQKYFAKLVVSQNECDTIFGFAKNAKKAAAEPSQNHWFRIFNVAKPQKCGFAPCELKTTAKPFFVRNHLRNQKKTPISENYFLFVKPILALMQPMTSCSNLSNHLGIFILVFRNTMIKI
jgi:hypothetical protein